MLVQALDYRMQPYPTTKTFLRTIFDKVRIKLEEDQHLERQKDSKTIASSKLKMNALPQLIDPRSACLRSTHSVGELYQ